ncbi:MAG: STAS/SEC14 domain-containing protein [Roseibacillus sp.]
MAIELQKADEIPILILRLSGIVEHQEHQPVIPLLERELEEGGYRNVLLDMRDLVSWQPSAVWEELRFDAELLTHFQRVAVVSDRTHHRWVAFFARHLSSAEIRSFHSSDIDAAKEWLVTGTQEGDSKEDTVTRATPTQNDGDSLPLRNQEVLENVMPYRWGALSLIWRLLINGKEKGSARTSPSLAGVSERRSHSTRLIPFLDI